MKPVKRPNILMIMTDSHNATVTGCYGNPIVRTPHLDGLADRGVTFDNCYCNSPVCVPSRLSFTSGKYISRVGAWGNKSDLPGPDFPSLPRFLNAAGYESVLCGKKPYVGDRYYGFEEIGATVSRRAASGEGVRRDPNDLALSPRYSERFDGFRVGAADENPVIRRDRQVTADVQQFLSERDPAANPFFLMAGYTAPHFPLIVPEEYWQPYAGRVPMPVIPDGYLESLPLNYQHMRVGFAVTDVPSDLVQRGRELYYGLVDWLDDQIGQMLTALSTSAVAEDTIVIYTSDHGDSLGEHGLWWKYSAFDPSSRVPLIISWPSRWPGGQRRAEACSLLDLAQTVAALGGVEAPPDWDGDSLTPWLDDPATLWKDLAVSEYYAHNIASGWTMLRTGPYKYVYHAAPDAHHSPERELYDLEDDPGELSNLAGHPDCQNLIQRLHLALLDELGDDPEAIERRCRADYAGAVRQAG